MNNNDKELLDVFADTLERNTELNNKMINTLDKIHKRDAIKDGITFGLFITLLIVLYLC